MVIEADPANMAEILERIRKRLRAETPEAQPPNPSPSSPAVESGEPPVVLAQLLLALQSTHGRLGQINPRPPGLHNRAVQLLKKFMRRLLAWYTRPIDDYQALNTQFLYQSAHLLGHQQEQLRQLDARLEEMSRELDSLRQELDALRKEKASVTHQTTSYESG